MAAIDQDLLAIRRAVYGREVREAIAHGIETCYSEVSAPAQIARIENRVDEIIDSLPQDYTELNNWVKKQLYITLAAAHVSQYWIPDPDGDDGTTALDGTITTNGLTITRESGFITLNGTLSIDSGSFLHVKLWPGALAVGVAADGSQAQKDLLNGWSYDRLSEYYEMRHMDPSNAHLFCPIVSGATTVTRGTWLASAEPPSYQIDATDWVAIGFTNNVNKDFMNTGRQLFLMLKSGTYTNYKFLPSIASGGNGFYVNGATLEIS